MLKVLSGKVKKVNNANKIATVIVDRYSLHSKYKKIIKISKKYKADFSKNDCGVFAEGSLVDIREHRPISKTKRWVLVKVY